MLDTQLLRPSVHQQSSQSVVFCKRQSNVTTNHQHPCLLVPSCELNVLYMHCRTYKRVMEEAAMLGSFIRLVDYMMIEALVDRTIGTVEELVAMLEAPRQSADKTHKVCLLYSSSTSRSLPALHKCNSSLHKSKQLCISQLYI